MRWLTANAALLVLGVGAASALAQAPAATRSAQRPDYSRQAPAANDFRSPHDSPGNSSVLRYYRNHEHDTYGWRNPGGVGRSPEYYPPGDQFQNPGSPTRVATYDAQPGATSRQAQLQALSVGNMRYQTLQNHIDAYGRPVNFGFFW